VAPRIFRVEKMCAVSIACEAFAYQAPRVVMNFQGTRAHEIFRVESR